MLAYIPDASLGFEEPSHVLPVGSDVKWQLHTKGEVNKIRIGGLRLLARGVD